MANLKISELVAVTTPTGASEFAVNEGGTTKKMTLTQLLAAGTEPGSFSTLAAVDSFDIGDDAHAANLAITMKTAAGHRRGTWFETAGLNRWVWRVDNVAESGSDAGADFEWLAYDDAGSLIGTALKLTRADMAAVFGGSLAVATDLTIGSDALATNLMAVLNTAAGQNREIVWRTGGVDRWVAQVTNSAESGSDAGSNFSLQARDDAGGLIGVALGVTRATMALTIGGDLNHDGANWGLAGAVPSAPQTGFTLFTNLSTLRTGDADTLTAAQLADILGTLIEDLKTKGVIAA